MPTPSSIELQEPGQPLLDELAERFGDDIIDADGALDRAKLATAVFEDAEAVKDLNAIVHPGGARRRSSVGWPATPAPTTWSFSTSR